ncbi:MAG: pantoate--beta-alanine ligase, partial [Gammaproteobacteria bacterium]|nr:pantoate--beta-alanine ligase [Gammaproteobacteria bacterium]
EEDVRKLTEFNVDLVFSPDVKSFYPEGKDAVQLIELGDITTILEGEKRPGHFAGVATVVKRLFDLVRPNQAIFGDKDFQQVMVIKQLVTQFSFDIEIVTMPTLRENDGLAMSSRNTRLTAEQRAKAPEIYKNLQIIKTALEEGCVDYIFLENQSFNNLIAAGFVPEYVVIRDAKNLLDPEKHDEPKSVLIAAKLGDVRLIDNIQV